MFALGRLRRINLLDKNILLSYYHDILYAAEKTIENPDVEIQLDLKEPPPFARHPFIAELISNIITLLLSIKPLIYPTETP